MTIEVTKKDFDDIMNFLENGNLVQQMNDDGLSLSAMAFVIESIHSAVKDARKTMEENNE